MQNQTVYPKRKQGGLFDKMVNAINSYNVGDIYKVSEMRQKLGSHSYWTERVGDYHKDLLSTKCIKRVKRGHYQVLGFIPDFLTLNMCEANRGYQIYKLENGKMQCTERGKKWKLGEPNPFITETESNPILSDAQLNELESKLKTVVSSEVQNGATPVKVYAIDKDKLTITVYVYSTSSIYNLSAPGTFRSLYEALYNLSMVKTDAYEIGEIYNIVTKNATSKSLSFAYSQMSDDAFEANQSKKDQIINILKQGLSAADAADLIVKLF